MESSSHRWYLDFHLSISDVNFLCAFKCFAPTLTTPWVGLLSPTGHGVDVKWSVRSKSLPKKARVTYLHVKSTNNERRRACKLNCML